MSRLIAFMLMLALALPSFAGEVPKVVAKPKPTLLFFINPNGRPCQMQLQILQSGMKDLEKVVQIRYVKTTEPADRDMFYQYGIRSLPNLILVDATGKEKVRFAPGIQELQVILQQIKNTK